MLPPLALPAPRLRASPELDAERARPPPSRDADSSEPAAARASSACSAGDTFLFASLPPYCSRRRRREVFPAAYPPIQSKLTCIAIASPMCW